MQRRVMNAAVIDSVRNLKELGERQYNDFFNSRLQSLIGHRGIICLYSDGVLTRQKPVSRNSYWPWNGTGICFQILEIANQVWDDDLGRHFPTRNQSSLPSISDTGKLRVSTKSDLLPSLKVLLLQTDEANSLLISAWSGHDRSRCVAIATCSNLSGPIHSLSM